jgi:hypothetical protein
MNVDLGEDWPVIHPTVYVCARVHACVHVRAFHTMCLLTGITVEAAEALVLVLLVLHAGLEAAQGPVGVVVPRPLGRGAEPGRPPGRHLHTGEPGHRNLGGTGGRGGDVRIILSH